MTKKYSLIKDLGKSLFSPHIFFTKRFIMLSPIRVSLLSFISVSLGLLLGALLNFFLTVEIKNLAMSSKFYSEALSSLNISSDNFLALLNNQKIYYLILMLLSPIIAFSLPHLLGGALHTFLRILMVTPKGLSYEKTLNCCRISLTSVMFYIIPLIGPFIVLVTIFKALWLSLNVTYDISKFTKIFAITFTIYICLILGSASLQLLAQIISN